MKCIS